MAKKKKRVYVVLRKRKLYYNRPVPTYDGGELDSFYPRDVSEFVAVFDNKEDAICCALSRDNCYVEKCKL